MCVMCACVCRCRFAGFKDVPWSEKQNLVKQVFRQVAPSYDIMNDLMSGGLHRLWKDRLVEKLRPAPGQVHLDIAGGTGDVAFRVADAIEEAARREGERAIRRPIRKHAADEVAAVGEGVEAGASSSSPSASAASSSCPFPAVPVARVIVSDVNESMLAEGRKRAEAERKNSRNVQLEWLLANAESLPLPDESVDSITVSFGIRNVTDRPKALREARRVLVPGGRFLCLEFSKVVVPGLDAIYDLYSFNAIPAIGQLVAGDAESYRYLVESIRKFPDQETWAETIEDAGFKGVDYENLTGGVVAIHSGFKLD